ncbi:UDP-N-acetylglucosamine--N-acetylmuramyl-(pentapeptide) pyrophosphoryl-undecaprenol N-acetylglucosamine transferase [Pelotomaculum schinkii]|uniref:UDP-N-acetylglucosamine--N-acetylmuramyl-(pentapeptide) pyrophosphoryl-undecaprenol N-acetylglucosamine transferase n=1 Tax=Pelotomaculum schinkii TaxID=78350 RepID=A0A4Y7RAR6_9FIRM|nr:UDP-N-acetylglucosamine--N-acetylmuramyl-(pentapeptide) pyrophosphoryl-undecaprenol N-acetylglucosamine transferase [Pelotomaculum schinkii]
MTARVVKTLRIVVAGGGTGGHIYPALAIARGLKERHPEAEILYVGNNQGMEADIVPKEGLPFKGLAGAGLERKLSMRNFLVLWRTGLGFWQAARTLRNWKPDVVIGTGGYVCGPVVLAAALSRIPTLIHEQNALPGVTNRILARFVDRVAVTFKESVKYFPRSHKVILTGLPVRPEILRATRPEGLKKLGIGADRFLLFSFGGSRGARTLNKAMVDVIKQFGGDPRLSILHVTGSAGYEEFLEDCAAKGIDLAKTGNVTIISYLYSMQDALAAAGLVISRAGAATCAEITALGIPSILVPYPFAAENHQEHNALALEKEGAALMFLDRKVSGDLLCTRIAGLLEDRGKLAAMAEASRKMGKTRALEDIIDCVDELVR